MSDTEIIEQCKSMEDHGLSPMIFPYFTNSVKQENGVKILSYGVSSFGYDVRLAENFKIFSNANASVIDPKNFDTSCLIDGILKEDPDGSKYVILPPNSYLLGHTTEVFNIPNDIIAVAIGKSTMARCFTEDTKIALTDGTSPDFQQFIKRYSTGERLYGYSLNNKLEVVTSQLVYPRKIGTEEVMEVELDNGTVIQCTPDHKFVTLSGLKIEAQYLQPGYMLYPLHHNGSLAVISSDASSTQATISECFKVVCTKRTNKISDVYCLNSPEFGNFALACGVFVNNCGVQVNCTPIEPGFRGTVVIEIANSTSLPVKIYANQGISQFLFFKGNRPCSVSYADRAGKYMDQTGIVYSKV